MDKHINAFQSDGTLDEHVAEIELFERLVEQIATRLVSRNS